MIDITRKQDCCGCYACEQICPTQAISMQFDDEGFWYPVVSTEKCIDCNLCVKVCPNIAQAEVSKKTEVVACYNNNLEDRMKSASGGIFPLIAKQIINNGGVVFGAGYNDLFEVEHSSAKTICEIDRFRGSKYVQSKIGNTYKEAKRYLNGGTTVLFTGTPCQIQGLKKYLGKEYDNLITIDLICHGVPSPKVWRKYLDEIKGNKNIKNIIPRDKSNGIKDAPIVFDFSDGSTLKQNYTKNEYIKGFSNNLYIRPSCYECTFKGVDRCSDITLGDFWGLEKFQPDFVDEYGISAILIHSEKGGNLIKSISEQTVISVATSEQVIKENPCLIDHISYNEKRDTFYNIWEKYGVKKTVRKLVKVPLNRRVNRINDFIRHGLWLIKNKLVG